MLDDADAGRLILAALVASAGIAAILLFAFSRAFAASKRNRAEAARQKLSMPIPLSTPPQRPPPRTFPAEDTRPQTSKTRDAKIEPWLFSEEEIAEDISRLPSRSEPPAVARNADRDGRRFGIGGLLLAFLIGIGIGAISAPWAWQSLGPLVGDLASQMADLGRAFSDRADRDTADNERSGSAANQEELSASDDAAILGKIRRRLPFEINPGIALVSIDIVDGFLDARIEVSRTFSENERRLFLLTATDRTIHIMCEVQANADLRELTERGYDIRVTYVDAAGERMRRDILAGPICPKRS